ncbi:hypothetical protein [Halorientalis halophila]|uniref:hypothetical protein n=1 Tax=Halorientalis halophila TaxID=3108499 RepID=UPI003008F313
MKWRCEYCGKPHERNDPPCDNCGHSEFEKAVVPMAPEADDDERTTTHAWICTECGNDHPKHTPPCDRCGNATLERRELSYDEDEIVREMLDDGTRSPSADVGYLEVLDAKLVAMFLGVGALVVLLALGFLGVIYLPGISPTPPVPGNATAADGLGLAAVETSYVESLNGHRAAAGYDELTADENVAAAATYVNQRVVRAEYGERDEPGVSRDAISDRLDGACEGGFDPATFSYDPDRSGGLPDTEGELGGQLADSYAGGGSEFADAPEGLVGVDVHAAPDGRLYVTQVTC